MQSQQQTIRSEVISCTNVLPTRQLPDIAEDVRESLLQRPRSLQPKYFYDERGSELFDQICSTPEYYPTRTENNLLTQYASKIIRQANPAQILELGSGYSIKTRRLFDACQDLEHHCSYAPFDVCEEALIDSALKLANEYHWLELEPLVGDYHGGLGNLPLTDQSRLFVFLGSTIGNFEQEQAQSFLQELTSIMNKDDHLLLGIDRVKEKDVLHAAYNDDQGITAEFNLNVLRVLNRELDANFDVNRFNHSAIFNSDEERIEMRLVSTHDQEILIKDLDESIRLGEGEDILTEISQKYTNEGIQKLFSSANLSIIDHYQDEQAYFSLILAKK